MATSAPTRRMPTSVARRLNAVAADPEIALLVSTYQKPWHLERVLTSIAMQQGVESRLEVVVTDDGSTDQTPRIVEEFARSVRFPVAYTTHPHETFQLARCRNQGVAASKAPYLLFLDGDCVLPPDHVLQHLKRRGRNRVMVGYCCRLDEGTSARFDEEAIRSCEYLDWIPRSQLRALAKRDLKARFYQLIRHPSKPKLASGNFGIWRRDYERVNGFDENYEGWGCEDDDLRLRVVRAGLRVESILRWTHTYHLWHPPDVTAPERIRDGLNMPYFNRKFRFTRCMDGLVKRSLPDVATGIVGAPSQPAAVTGFLNSHGINAGGESPAEVELLFLPGKGHFSGRADCNILVVLEDSPRAKRLARKAHVVLADPPCPGIGEKCCFRLCEFDRALSALT